jgi:hypothetical protein
MQHEPDHSAAPEQIEHGFDEGIGARPRPSIYRRVGRFSDGIAARALKVLRRRRFSEGIERSPDSPRKDAEGRFDNSRRRAR